MHLSLSLSFFLFLFLSCPSIHPYLFNFLIHCKSLKVHLPPSFQRSCLVLKKERARPSGSRLPFNSIVLPYTSLPPSISPLLHELQHSRSIETYRGIDSCCRFASPFPLFYFISFKSFSIDGMWVLGDKWFRVLHVAVGEKTENDHVRCMYVYTLTGLGGLWFLLSIFDRPKTRSTFLTHLIKEIKNKWSFLIKKKKNTKKSLGSYLDFIWWASTAGRHQSSLGHGGDGKSSNGQFNCFFYFLGLVFHSLFRFP